MTPKSIIRKIFRKVQRYINQLKRYQYPAVCNGWIKDPSSPVWGNKLTGTMFDPYCYKDTDGSLKMVVSDRQNGSLILLKSADGRKWEKISDILLPNPGSWQDIVNRGCLIYKDDEYWLWYTGQYNGKSRIGLAKGKDYKSLSPVTEDPVLSPTIEWEGISVMNPCVIWDETLNRFRMWYSAGENYEPDVICYAESADGINWEKHKSPVLNKDSNHEWEKYKVGGCQVIKKDDGKFSIYYIGYQNVDVARICIAHSNDGINWIRTDNNLLLSPSVGAWDSDAVYKPTVVEHAGKLLLYYNGRRNRDEYIGLAIKSNNPTNQNT